MDAQNVKQLLIRFLSYSWLVCILVFRWEMCRLSKSSEIRFLLHFPLLNAYYKGETIFHGRRRRVNFRRSINKSAVVWQNEERILVKWLIFLSGPFRSSRNLIYLCQIFVIWRENQTSEIKVFKIFQATIMNSSMDEVKEKEIAFLPENFYNVRFSENYCFAVHKEDAESLSWCVSLWCSGQGAAWTCRSTGFDSRRRRFQYPCIVFGLFFLTLFSFQK